MPIGAVALLGVDGAEAGVKGEEELQGAHRAEGLPCCYCLIKCAGVGVGVRAQGEVPGWGEALALTGR